jgi:hypothetical protein
MILTDLVKIYIQTKTNVILSVTNQTIIIYGVAEAYKLKIVLEGKP